MELNLVQGLPGVEPGVEPKQYASSVSILNYYTLLPLCYFMKAKILASYMQSHHGNFGQNI